MLTSTFIHIPGIGHTTEKKLWQSGITNWDTSIDYACTGFSQSRQKELSEAVTRSCEKLAQQDAAWFEKRLASNQHFRLFPEFRQNIAFLDIETTGLDTSSTITTIALYDGQQIMHYVQGDNLNCFVDDIQKYQVLVTYNGRAFDIPFIESYFNIQLSQSQIDLRYVLAHLGYKGGLKKCEIAMGIDRKDLSGVDGYFAVLLWNDFKKNRNTKALETLLAYNIEDVINLEVLLIKAYNENIEKTILPQSLKIKMAELPENPFQADSATIQRIKRTVSYF